MTVISGLQHSAPLPLYNIRNTDHITFHASIDQWTDPVMQSKPLQRILTRFSATSAPPLRRLFSRQSGNKPHLLGAFPNIGLQAQRFY